jgi:hypothetical protein
MPRRIPQLPRDSTSAATRHQFGGEAESRESPKWAEGVAWTPAEAWTRAGDRTRTASSQPASDRVWQVVSEREPLMHTNLH